MTEKELISTIQSLKQIKPRKDWVVLAKMNIMGSGIGEVVKPTYKTNFSAIFGMINQKRMAYALASFLLIFAGVFSVLKFGFLQNPTVNVAKNSTASILAESTAETTLKSSVADFKAKSQTLAILAKNTSTPQVISSAIQQAQAATKKLTETIQKNPELVKSVALDINNNSNASLLDIPGGDSLKATSDDLYKTIDDQMIADLKSETLNDDQKTALKSIETSYNKGDYMIALRDILLMNASQNTPAAPASK